MALFRQFRFFWNFIRSLPCYDGMLFHGYVHCCYATVTSQLKYCHVSVTSPLISCGFCVIKCLNMWWTMGGLQAHWWQYCSLPVGGENSVVGKSSQWYMLICIFLILGHARLPWDTLPLDIAHDTVYTKNAVQKHAFLTPFHISYNILGMIIINMCVSN